MSSLFTTSANDALFVKMRSRGREAGLPAHELEQIERRTRANMSAMLDGTGVPPHEIADLYGLSLHVAIERAAGRLTAAMVSNWDRIANDDLRASGLSPARSRAIRRAAEKRLHIERPVAFDALARAHPLARHPRVSRIVTDWHRRRNEQDGAKGRKAAYTSKGPDMPARDTSAGPVSLLGLGA